MEALTVQVRIRAPDPKGLIYYTISSGCTEQLHDLTVTVCASGIIAGYSEGNAIVVTPALPFSPFLEDNPDVLRMKSDAEVHVRMARSSNEWISAKLVAIHEFTSIQTLLNRLHTALNVTTRVPALSSAVAIVKFPVATSPSTIPCGSQACFRTGRAIYSVVSPYSVAMPELLAGLVTAGVISNVIHSSSGVPKVFLTDVRCLPGSEGSPIFDRLDNKLLGIMLQPIRVPHVGFDARQKDLTTTTGAFSLVITASEIQHLVPGCLFHWDDSQQLAATVPASINHQAVEASMVQ